MVRGLFTKQSNIVAALITPTAPWENKQTALSPMRLVTVLTHSRDAIPHSTVSIIITAHIPFKTSCIWKKWNETYPRKIPEFWILFPTYSYLATNRVIWKTGNKEASSFFKLIHFLQAFSPSNYSIYVKGGCWLASCQASHSNSQGFEGVEGEEEGGSKERNMQMQTIIYTQTCSGLSHLRWKLVLAWERKAWTGVNKWIETRWWQTSVLDHVTSYPIKLSLTYYHAVYQLLINTFFVGFARRCVPHGSAATL